ncbi:MAG: hypothetical protein ACRC0X_06135 [Brevinema sp.]
MKIKILPVILILFWTLSCTLYVKPNLYELDINDPDFEKKARFNQIEIDKARQENERRKAIWEFFESNDQSR